MTLRGLLLLAALGSSLAGVAGAQEWAEYELPAGARVRMTVEGTPVEGYLSGRQGDSLRLRLPGANPFAGEMAVPLAAATRVEVHVGQKRHTKLGALIGAVAMGLVGIWEPVSTDPGCGQGTAPSCSRADAVIGGIVGGAAVGALVGRVIKTDQWAPVPPEVLTQLPPTPDEIREAPGGPGVPAGRQSPARVNVRF